MSFVPHESRKTGWSRCRFIGAAALFQCFLCHGWLLADDEPREFEVKAAVLFKFTQFIKWPANALPPPGTPFTIGILGADPFGRNLDNVVRGEKVAGRNIAIKRGQNAAALKGCQVIYVSKSEQARLGNILQALQGTSTLTVGEGTQFCDQGGMIGFLLKGDKVSFRIKSGAAKKEGLEISPNLIKISD
jgi:hypothetical protein